MTCEWDVGFFVAEQRPAGLPSSRARAGTRRDAAPTVATRCHSRAVMASSGLAHVGIAMPTRSDARLQSRRACLGGTRRASAPRSAACMSIRGANHHCVDVRRAPRRRARRLDVHIRGVICPQGRCSPCSASPRGVPSCRQAPWHPSPRRRLRPDTRRVSFLGDGFREPRPFPPKRPSIGCFQSNNEPLLQASLRPVLSGA